MAIRAATLEFSQFLVKNSSNNPEKAEILDTCDYILMKKNEAEYAVASSSPLSPPELPAKSALSSESPPNSPFRIRKRKRMILPATKAKKDKQLPPNQSAPTPLLPTTKPEMFVTTSTQTTPTDKELQAFLFQQSLQAIEKQLQLRNTRLDEMERILTRQGKILKELVSTCSK